MKFTFCATVIALAVTQVIAVVPKPIKECTKSVIVLSTDTTCMDFAQRHGVTFEDLLHWNQKLSRDCANLDVGHPVCVSVTKGACCLNEDPNKPMPTTTIRSSTTMRSTTTTTKSTTIASGATTTTTTTSPPPPPSTTTTITTTTTPPPPPPIAPTTSDPVVPPLLTATGTTTVDVPPTSSTSITLIIPSVIDNSNQTGNNAAVAAGLTKGSMILAVVGVILSAAYIF